jgi:hypothetical protein
MFGLTCPLPHDLIFMLIRFSVADPGCSSRFPDPNFFIQDPESRVKKIPDPHKRIYVFLTLKTVSKLSEK